MGEQEARKKIAINGFGRIGRCVLRAYLERPELHSKLCVAAINEIADTNTLIHLLKYDSTHGRLNAEVLCEQSGDELELLSIVDAHEHLHHIALSHAQNIPALDWDGIDVVLECTGGFSDRQSAQMHLEQGASKVLYSQPANADVDNTVVYGVNHDAIESIHRIISNASCTTNASVPVIDCLHKAFGIESGAITTLHSAMNDQPVIDAYHHTDLRKTRAAIGSMIPVHTELAKGIERILPAMKGKFTAHAIRVPTINVSAIDLTLTLSEVVTVEQVNECLAAAAQEQYSSVMSVTYEKLASTDFNHDPHSVIVDASQTQVANGNMLKLLLWFDNEWGYANRMLDVAVLL